MKILIACEHSGAVRRAFRARGHEAWSCDLLPTDDDSPFHFTGDIFKLWVDGRRLLEWGWDALVCHPPCKFLALSGMHRTARGLRPRSETDKAIRFAERLWAAPIARIALENPRSILSTQSNLGKRTQEIQPFQFGHDASKGTWLWLKNLPPLVGTKWIEPRIVRVNGKLMRRWANQTDSGQNRLGPSKNRWKIRSATYSGIAEAMAEQWGCL